MKITCESLRELIFEHHSGELVVEVREQLTLGRAAASDFFSEANVPQQAITMGLGTIFEARKILLMALGEHVHRKPAARANRREPPHVLPHTDQHQRRLQRFDYELCSRESAAGHGIPAR